MPVPDPRGIHGVHADGRRLRERRELKAHVIRQSKEGPFGAGGVLSESPGGARRVLAVALVFGATVVADSAGALQTEDDPLADFPVALEPRPHLDDGTRRFVTLDNRSGATWGRAVPVQPRSLEAHAVVHGLDVATAYPGIGDLDLHLTGPHRRLGPLPHLRDSWT